MFTTYILKSLTNHKFYAGSTQDLNNRLIEHNSGETKSTKSGIPWEVVYNEVFHTRSEAVKREYQIKGRGIRRFLIDINFPV